MIDFFQTLNVKRFVFADGDNVNNPKVFIDFLNEQKFLELDTRLLNTKKVKNGLKISEKNVRELVNSLLQIKTNKRPKKIATLKNVMKNNFKKIVFKENFDVYAEEVIKELQKRKKVTIKDQTINWK